MILDLAHESTVVACVKSLSNAMKRRPPVNDWLLGDSVTFLRAEIYNRDAIQGWGYRHDAIAVRRVRIWLERIAA